MPSDRSKTISVPAKKFPDTTLKIPCYFGGPHSLAFRVMPVLQGYTTYLSDNYSLKSTKILC